MKCDTRLGYTSAEVTLQLDVSAEGARALHRVVRAMHDGHCPACNHLGSSESFEMPDGEHICPKCEFCIDPTEAEAALKAFAPHFQKSYDLFIQWREGRAV